MNACPASGEDQPTDEPPITYLEKGDAAPFAGDLFPPTKSARLGLRLEHCQGMAAADVAKVTRIMAIEIQREKDKGAAALDAERAKRALAEARVAELSVWWRSPEFVAVVAIGGAVALIIGAAYLSDAVLNGR